MPPWRCTTSFGRPVVPDEVKTLQAASASRAVVLQRRVLEQRLVGRAELDALGVDGLERGRVDQQPRARAVDDVLRLARAEASVHRYGDGAQPGERELQLEPGRHVRQPDRDAIARTDAARLEARGEPARAVVEFGVQRQRGQRVAHRRAPGATSPDS